MCATKQQLLDWLLEVHNINVTKQWLNFIVAEHPDKICITNANSIDDNRCSITPSIVKQYQSQLQVALIDVHPFLIINMDESSLGECKIHAPKKVLAGVLNTGKQHFFRSTFEGSHITFVVAISTNGDLLKPMAISKRVTIDEELSKHGIPGKNMFISYSSKGYMTKRLFKE